MTSELLKWWKGNARQFPWRFESNRYRLLMAELLLHRTRAENVVSVYKKFIQEIPDLKTLSIQSESQLEKMISSLGLARRVKLMLRLARVLVDQFGEQIPCDLEDLKQLPGIGDYTASAILIFSCDSFLPLLDTNTVRITARYFGLEQTDSSRKMKRFGNYVILFLDNREVSASYYALIDLGALVCKSVNPECLNCPLRKGCDYFNKKIRC